MAKFALVALGKAGVSSVRPAVREPTNTAVVRTSLREALTELGVFARADVSDAHSDASKAEWPADDATDVESSAKLLPNRVMLEDPVTPRLAVVSTLAEPTSNVHTSVADPTSVPVVNMSWADCARPAPTAQRIEVSDSQVVRSVLVERSESAAVNELRPMLDPCIVTLPDPVETRLVRLIELMATISTEWAAVKLPSRAPAVNEIFRLSTMLCADWHRIVVSASHVVRSHALLPGRTADVNVPRPKLEPVTVMLIDAVAATLAR